MKKFSVAICIPTFNQSQYLHQCISSALDQNYENLEVYVCDDKSTDDTSTICENFQKKFKNFYYKKNLENLGIAKNVNKLLRLPKTDFIVRLDSDDYLHPDYVRELVCLFEKHPEAGVGHVNVQEIDKNGENTRKRLLDRSKEYYPAEQSLKETIYGYKVAANICMFKRSVLEKLNFTSGRPEYTEDYDLWIRIADAEYGNVFSSKILAYYRVWVDGNNYRVSIKRKESELLGYYRMFTECIEPAFKKRNWKNKPIEIQREKFALEHAVALKNNFFSKAEKEIIKRRVLKIWDSRKVRNRITVYSAPDSLKARIFYKRRIWLVRVKDFVKHSLLNLRNVFSCFRQNIKNSMMRRNPNASFSSTPLN